MMADIRNDIIELQEKVFGGRRGISLDSPPHSSGEMEFAEWGSGQGEVMLNTWPLTKQQAWLSAACRAVKVPAGCHSKDPPRKKTLVSMETATICSKCVYYQRHRLLDSASREHGCFLMFHDPSLWGVGAAECLQDRGCEPNIST